MSRSITIEVDLDDYKDDICANCENADIVAAHQRNALIIDELKYLANCILIKPGYDGVTRKLAEMIQDLK